MLDQEFKQEWITEQNLLHKKLVMQDQNWKTEGNELKLIGAVDLRFVNREETEACAGIVILDYPDLDVVYEKYEMVEVKTPYIPGYLAFRYLNFYVNLIQELKVKQPHLFPQIFFINGNGVLHPRKFGIASHLGVLMDVPTIGIGKNLLLSDGLLKDLGVGLSVKEIRESLKENCKQPGDYYEIKNDDDEVLGVAVISSEVGSNPIYVSVGHRIALDTAIDLTLELCEYRIPEPIRIAGYGCDEYLRVHVYEKSGLGARREYKNIQKD